MLNFGTWRLFLWLHKGDIIHAAYRGVLGRESDPSGFAAYKKHLGRSRDLAQLLSGLAQSDEFWDKTIAWRAPDLVKAAYVGLLGREPDPEAQTAYGADLSEKRELSAFLNDIIRSNEFWNRIIALHSTNLVRAAYLGLLGREPDPDAQTAYGEALSEKRELPAFLSDIIRSDEFWNRIIAVHSANLVRAAYLGLLGKEPDPEAQAAYGEALSKKREMPAFLNDITRSDEFWKRTISLRAPDLVRAVYLGLLGREPDPKAEAAYCASLSEKRGLAGMLTDFIRSNEFWDKIVASRAPEIVRAVHRGLYKTEPNPEKLKEYTDLLGDSGKLNSVIPAMVNSDEFALAYNQQRKLPHPSEKYNDPCLVFIHIQKTAGTSIQNHLSECFTSCEFYREFSDSLYMFSPGELSMYNVFAGHFNYDSLGFIPRKKLSVFTFVRDPKKRLISLYHFWRAHEPGHESYDGGIPIANLLLIEEFFENERILPDFGLWNHMSWAIMGKREWEKWRVLLLNETNSQRIQDFLEGEVRPAVIERLNSFIFIGFQEDFERSVKALYEILHLPHPGKIRTDKSLDGLMNSPNFKKVMDKQPFTARLDAALDRFVQVDNMIYEEARNLYSKWTA